jgi:diguanylate cyclase (GGDEF)-like protein/PAS domain S-box-containing protein
MSGYAPLGVVLVEDNPLDAELVSIGLADEGFEFTLTRVETEAEYRSALATRPDIVLSDWRLPRFSGLQALKILHETELGLPFVIVSGSIGEEMAVDALHAGADDYVLKDRLARLGAAVRRALADHRQRLERERANAELRLAATVFESIGEGLMVTDSAGTILAVNRAFEEITGYSSLEAIGQNPRMLQSKRHDAGFYRAMWSTLNATGRWRGELWNRRKNGGVYPEWLTINVVKGPDDRVLHYVAVFRDVGDVKQAQAQIDYLAHHDALTGLPNRILILDRIDQALRRAHADATPVAVMILDLDEFGAVNDALGPAVGDEFLWEIGRRVGEQLGSRDSVARLGGDEFAIVLDDPRNAAQVVSIARALQERVASPVDLEERLVVVTGSIGISLFPDDASDAGQLISHAESALRQAKTQGRGSIGFFEPGLAREFEERLALESLLRGAVGRGELIVQYQPQVSLADGSLVGAEALVRWRHPELGVLPPVVFVPLAEEIGVIGDIGAWVLRAACRQVVAWDAAGFHLPQVSVNLSAQQLDRPDLAASVRAILAEVGLAPERLEMELTESVAMRGTAEGTATLIELRGMGVKLAMDDFGTGQAWWDQLRRIPLNCIKLDMSFVSAIGVDKASEEAIRAMVVFAQNLGLRTVAEGIEQARQAAFLREAGCDVGQGYLFDRPLSAEDLLNGYDIQQAEHRVT